MYCPAISNLMAFDFQISNPKLSVEEVRTLYAHQYPDIATATITGPEAVGDKLRYQFTRAIGSKG